MPASPLGERIMKRLHELDRDRGWLAKQVGRDLSTIHRWINGSRKPSERDVRDLALVLHRSEAWLNGSDERTPGGEPLVAA